VRASLSWESASARLSLWDGAADPCFSICDVIIHRQEAAGKYFSPGGHGSILPAGRDLVTKPDLLTQILGFLSTIARFIGSVIVHLVQYILPSVRDLATLAEPIGYLALLTLFVILTSAARKVALVILLAGWALIFIRILLMAFRVG